MLPLSNFYNTAMRLKLKLLFPPSATTTTTQEADKSLSFEKMALVVSNDSSDTKSSSNRREKMQHSHPRPQPPHWQRRQRPPLPVLSAIQMLLVFVITTIITLNDNDNNSGSNIFVSCVPRKSSSSSSRGSSTADHSTIISTRREEVEKLVGPYHRSSSTLNLPSRIIQDYLLQPSTTTHPNPHVRVKKDLYESSRGGHGSSQRSSSRRGPKGCCNNVTSRRCSWFGGIGSRTNRILNSCRGGSSSETSSSDSGESGSSVPKSDSDQDSTVNESHEGMTSVTTTPVSTNTTSSMTTTTTAETSTVANSTLSTQPTPAAVATSQSSTMEQSSSASSASLDSLKNFGTDDVKVESSATANQTTAQQPQILSETSTDTAVAATMTSVPSSSSSSTQVVQVEQPSGNESKAVVEKTREDEQHPDDDPKVLMLIRVLFFAYYASLGSLLPYLPVYYHSLGHGGQIIGMLGAIKPFTTFLVAPLWGVVSDQTGSPFIVLYFTFVVSLLGQLMVSWRHDHLWIMVMVFLTAVFNAPVKSLLDSMVMSNLKDRSRYGRLRLWGQLGFGVGSSCVGYLLSKSHHDHVPYTPKSEGTSWMQHLDDVWQTITGYKLLFFTYMVLSIPTFICIRAFDQMTRERQQQNQQKEEQQKQLEQKEDKNDNDESMSTVTETKPSVLDGITVLLQNSDAIFFFFLVLVVGISSGIIENFAYVRIREVGGTGKEMGLCRLVSSLAGAPMFWFSGSLTELLGADRVIVVGLINYVVRYFNYALIKSPLQALPAEALRGMTFAAFWSTCTIYATRIAPPGMQATMLMFLNAMYGGLGQSLGAIIGGKLQSHVGTVHTFLYAGLFDTLFVGLVIAYLKVRKDSSFKNPQPIVPKIKK